MFVTRKESFGNIEIEKNFFAQLLKHTLKKYDRKIWPANKKGKIVDFFSLTDSLENYGKDGELKIKIYLIYKFGISFKETTSDIVNEYSKMVKSTLGELPSEITVSIVGVKSVKIARRYIDVKNIIQ